MHVFEFRNLRNLRNVPYRCEWCGETFNTESALQEHINKEHTRENNGADTGGSFKYEEYSMDVFDDMRHKCQYCGLTFKTESELQEHINRYHSGRSNGAGSKGSFKYEKYGRTCGEPFNVDQSIILSDSTSCELFSIFEHLQTFLEKTEELKSEKKTAEKCFKILKKSKDEKDIKGQGPKRKQNNEAEQQHNPASHQEFSPASAEKNLQ
ncbi:zinc finger protein 724-like [Centruroides sculpturatus]|uniref:zinc finger protein 724-like n=1 Tax=Centruroides sculpturatus TaxID=218467 RepID=UPI000C6E246D|nr:zinc finger protein 724-like [Centruroides sculpturatus]